MQTLPRVAFPVRRRPFFASLGLLLAWNGCIAAPATPAWWRDLDLYDLAQHSLPAPKQTLVVVFLDPECPVANGYLPVLNVLATEFARPGVLFLGAYSDPASSLDQLRSHVRDFALNFAIVDDRRQRLARYAGATHAAEAAVFDSSGVLLYRGRIDDRVGADGAGRPAATRHDLREVLQRICAGERGPFPGRPGYGCPLAVPVKPP